MKKKQDCENLLELCVSLHPSEWRVLVAALRDYAKTIECDSMSKTILKRFAQVIELYGLSDDDTLAKRYTRIDKTEADRKRAKKGKR